MSLFKQETQAIETHWFPRNSLHYYQRSRWAVGIQFTLTCRSRLSEWVSDFDFVSTGAISAERCCLNYQTWCRANICGYRNQSILDQLATDRKKKKIIQLSCCASPKRDYRRKSLRLWMRLDRWVMKSGGTVSDGWNHIIVCVSKLYPLVEPYLIDIFRHAVNLVGARHREIFSQDHKRFFPWNVYPRKRRGGNGETRELDQTIGEAMRPWEWDDTALPKPHSN